MYEKEKNELASANLAVIIGFICLCVGIGLKWGAAVGWMVFGVAFALEVLRELRAGQKGGTR